MWVSPSEGKAKACAHTLSHAHTHTHTGAHRSTQDVGVGARTCQTEASCPVASDPRGVVTKLVGNRTSRIVNCERVLMMSSCKRSRRFPGKMRVTGFFKFFIFSAAFCCLLFVGFATGANSFFFVLVNREWQLKWDFVGMLSLDSLARNIGIFRMCLINCKLGEMHWDNNLILLYINLKWFFVCGRLKCKGP